MSGKISNNAVMKRTGRNWQEWYKILDGAGAKKMNHKDTVTWIYYNNDVSGWWAQMITVNYEQAVKGRKKHEKLWEINCWWEEGGECVSHYLCGEHWAEVRITGSCGF